MRPLPRPVVAPAALVTGEASTAAPVPASVNVRLVVTLSESTTGWVLKVSTAGPVKSLNTRRSAPLFCRLKPKLGLPANWIELVPLMMP